MDEKKTLPLPNDGQMAALREYFKAQHNLMEHISNNRDTMTDFMFDRHLAEARDMVYQTDAWPFLKMMYESLTVERADSYKDPSKKHPYMRLITKWQPVKEN